MPTRSFSPHASDAAVWARPVRLEGGDALTVLHRIGTQAVDDLVPGAVRTTLFCDFRGRLMHRVAVAVTRDRAVWLLRSDGPADELAALVDQHVFREQVQAGAPTEPLRVVSVPGGFDLPAGSIEEQDGVPIRVQLEETFGLHLMREDDMEPGSPGSTAALEIERIGAGRPRHRHEIRIDFNPFEVGLGAEVHLAKGCYTGQEALLRLQTYKSVRRRLVRLAGRETMPAAGDDLLCDGVRMGVVTSTAALESEWIGLGVLRREALEPGSRLEVLNAGPVSLDFVFPEAQPLGLPV